GTHCAAGRDPVPHQPALWHSSRRLPGSQLPGGHDRLCRSTAAGSLPTTTRHQHTGHCHTGAHEHRAATTATHYRTPTRTACYQHAPTSHSNGRAPHRNHARPHTNRPPPRPPGNATPNPHPSLLITDHRPTDY